MSRQVIPPLRQMVVFAPQNVLRDAPFTKLDLVTCRNMLIYLRPDAQKKVLSLFHFGLRSGGALMLGTSETPGELSDEFQPVDQKHRIYRKRRDVSLLAGVPLASPLSPVAGGAEHRLVRSANKPQLAERQVVAAYEHLSRSRLAPSFVVNAQGERADISTMLVRWAIVWLPLLLPMLAVALIFGWGKNTAGFILGLAVLILWIGVAIHAAVHPHRGLHNRLAGTWVVRR